VKATLPRPDALEAYFTCFRDKRPLAIKAHPAPGAGPNTAPSLQVGAGCLGVVLMCCCVYSKWVGG
jgi:hypothetical protein